MNKDDDKPCVVCGAYFPKDKLKDGKCSLCYESFPFADSRKEATAQAAMLENHLIPSIHEKVKNIIEEYIAQYVKCNDIPAMVKHIRENITDSYIEAIVKDYLKNHKFKVDICDE